MELIKNLRTASGAPIVDCKKALAQTDNDLQAALDWLREHGAAKVSSKVGDREASEGLVGFHVSDDSSAAALVHVASETDFAGRSDTFCELVEACAEAALQQQQQSSSSSSTDGVLSVADVLKLTVTQQSTNEEKTIEKLFTEAVVAIRENLSLTQATSFASTSSDGVVAGYVHGRVLPSNAGRAAAMVELSPIDTASTAVDKDTMLEVGKLLAMHIVAAKPKYLNPDSVPADILEEERSMLTKQMADTKKPPEIMEKIVNGRLRKFYESICLVEQNHMIEEGNPKIGKHLESLGLQLHRYALVSIQ